jgi:hypothetical protein
MSQERVRVLFKKPIGDRELHFLLLLYFGYRKGNYVTSHGEAIVGLDVWKDDWLKLPDILRAKLKHYKPQVMQ